MSKPNNEQKERMKAPSEALERGIGRFQLNGTDLEEPSWNMEAKGGDTSMRWKCGISFANPSWATNAHKFIDFNTPTFRNGICSWDLNF